MTDDALSVSVVINASVERVWSLLIEQQQSNEQTMLEQKYFQIDPKGPLAEGQVIHVKSGFLHATTCIDQIVQADPPSDGQTIFARVTFLGKEGESVVRWFRDSEHYHIQRQSEIKHPWCTFADQTNIRCIAMDPTWCVVVYVKQSKTTFRLFPRWLTQLLQKDEMEGKVAAKPIEAYLQNIKTKAEQNIHQAKRK